MARDRLSVPHAEKGGVTARRTARRVRTFLAGLEQLEQLGNALELAGGQAAKDLRDRTAGVIDLVEVKPGVFAMPAPRPRPAPRTRVHAKLLELEGDARSTLAAFEQLRGALWPK